MLCLHLIEIEFPAGLLLFVPAYNLRIEPVLSVPIVLEVVPRAWLMLVGWQMTVFLVALLGLPENLVRVALSEALEELLAHLSPENLKVSSRVEPLAVAPCMLHIVTNLSDFEPNMPRIAVPVLLEPSVLAVAAIVIVAGIAVALEPSAVPEDQPVPVAIGKSAQVHPVVFAPS